MNLYKDETAQARLISFGSIAVTLTMISGSVTDPVNAPKFFVLGAIGFACIALLASSLFKQLWIQQRVLVLTVFVFLLAGISAIVASNAPLSQNLYGTYGRNNGFIAYLSLAAILLIASSLNSARSYTWIAFALLFSGAMNVLYCSWVLLFGDFMGWNNQYNNLLGTFGNPNFIGSFLSIFVSTALAFAVAPKIKTWIRIGLVSFSAVAVLEMIHTNVMQGKVVLALGALLVAGALIRSYSSKVWITYVYFGLSFVLGIFAILGMLQRGPLTKYIYQYTVSLRGEYWKAGIETGASNFLTGVGFDTFGDWYRRTRSAEALIRPGVDVTVNTSHNVPIDLFAFGGFPLALPYLIIVILTIICIIKTFVSQKTYDPVFVALSVGWIGYQAQSVISINQLGLAVWGWVLSGALLGYSRLKMKEVVDNSNQMKKTYKNFMPKEKIFTPSMAAGIGLIAGAIVAVPPLSSDMNLMNAQVSRSAEKLEQSLITTYLHPQNSNMYLNTLIVFEQSGLNAKALEIAKKALAFNSDSFETWRALYFLKDSTDEDRARALQNMKRLDPLNPDVTAGPK